MKEIVLTEEFFDELDAQRKLAETDPEAMLAPDAWEEEFMDFENLGPMPDSMAEKTE